MESMVAARHEDRTVFRKGGSWDSRSRGLGNFNGRSRGTRDSIRRARERNPIAMFAVRDAKQIASCSPDGGGSGVGESGSRDVRLFIVVIVFQPYLNPQPPPSRRNPICNGNAVFNAALILRPP